MDLQSTARTKIKFYAIRNLNFKILQNFLLGSLQASCMADLLLAWESLIM
jgi:hypothetical protein